MCSVQPHVLPIYEYSFQNTPLEIVCICVCVLCVCVCVMCVCFVCVYCVCFVCMLCVWYVIQFEAIWMFAKIRIVYAWDSGLVIPRPNGPLTIKLLIIRPIRSYLKSCSRGVGTAGNETSIFPTLEIKVFVLRRNGNQRCMFVVSIYSRLQIAQIPCMLVLLSISHSRTFFFLNADLNFLFLFLLSRLWNTTGRPLWP